MSSHLDLVTPTKRGSLVSVGDLTDAELRELIDRARTLESLWVSGEFVPDPYLATKSVVALFYEKSTRTRLSFEQAALRLGVKFASIDISNSSVQKGESIRKTMETVSAAGYDAVILRHGGEGMAAQCDRWVPARMINAGDGCHEHPTQAISDVLALASRLGGIEGLLGLRVALVGDITHSRVARSVTLILGRMGCQVEWIGPNELLPSWGFGEVKRSSSLDDRLPELDVVYMLRVQFERHLPYERVEPTSYVARFQLNEERMERFSPKLWAMHPGPMNVGVEVDGYVAESSDMISNEQVYWGTFGRMAVFERALKSKGRSL